MRTRTKWLVAGGAAAFVLTPVVAVSASTPLDADVHRGGVVLDAEAANRARAERLAETAEATPTASPTPSRAASKAPGDKVSQKPTPPAAAEPSGKKTVSAESPVSPHSSLSPVSPRTAG